MLNQGGCVPATRAQGVDRAAGPWLCPITVTLVPAPAAEAHSIGKRTVSVPVQESVGRTPIGACMRHRSIRFIVGTIG